MKSWSGIRKILEQDRLAPSLRGRVSYFITRYREAHDDQGRLAILVEGKELFKANPWSSKTGQWIDWHEVKKQFPSLDYTELATKAWNLNLREGFGDCGDFYRAFEEYDTQDVEKSLISENPLVRAMAILDRRVGKRRLKRLMEQGFSHEPQWLQAIYRLRLEAEEINSKENI